METSHKSIQWTCKFFNFSQPVRNATGIYISILWWWCGQLAIIKWRLRSIRLHVAQEPCSYTGSAESKVSNRFSKLQNVVAS